MKELSPEVRFRKTFIESGLYNERVDTEIRDKKEKGRDIFYIQSYDYIHEIDKEHSPISLMREFDSELNPMRRDISHNESISLQKRAGLLQHLGFKFAEEPPHGIRGNWVFQELPYEVIGYHAGESQLYVVRSVILAGAARGVAEERLVYSKNEYALNKFLLQ